MVEYDTWLTQDDISRIWRVATGELAEEFATTDELEEFASLLQQAAHEKWGMAGATLH